MKKLLSILLSVVIAATCFTGASGAVEAQGGETSGNQTIGSAVSTSALPVVPSGKEFIQNATTYCNPISLTQGSGRVSRGGEPVVKIFNGDYYLFISFQKGYWWSNDFANWTYVSAPNLLGGIVGITEIDGKLYNYAGNTENRVRTTDDPKSGIWYDCGTFSSNNYGDASMLYDEESGRLFMYYGWSQILGIRVVELDKTTFKEIDKPVVCLWGDPHNHGWETRYKDDLIFPYFTDREYRPQEYGWTEGPHPLKYNGKYYVLYSSIGLEFASYAQGVYVADDPLGPYVYDENNPLTRNTSGVAPGAGHGSIFLDKQGKLWTICMTAFTQSGGNGNTLISLYPSDFDAEGVAHGNVEFCDYPQYLPGVKTNPVKDNFTGWMLLSLNKQVETSSTLVNYWPALAVDQDGKSYWSAQTGDPGEYITVDLGKESDIRGIQTLWDRAGATASYKPLTQYHSYTVEVSNDNKNWTTIIDKSNNTQDLESDYIELPTAVTGRYVKLTNVFTPDNGKFAVKELRVFGNPNEATFTKVDNVMAVRSQLDRRNANLLWEPVDGADGYVVRYGIEPNKLYNSDMVYGKNYLNIKTLNVDPEYYFEVEAFSSGTPHYVENSFETRGRGAELDLIRQPTGGTRSTSRQMTYETYGKDEVYVFNDITPGTYTLQHTYGVGIWGPQQLTEKQLIGTGTQPTVTALNLTQFGNGSTQWGTVEVRVYPGETSGRIEVTLKYGETYAVNLTVTDSINKIAGAEVTVGSLYQINPDTNEVYTIDPDTDIVQMTDSNGKAKFDLDSGDYAYIVTKTGYDTASGTFKVSSSGASLTKTVILKRNSDIVSTPTANPPAGKYSSTQSVSLSASTPDASIYYTTDGSTPSTSSKLYDGSISVKKSMIIKAIAAKDGFVNSDVATFNYTISSGSSGSSGGRTSTQNASAPTADPGSGTYTSAQSVRLSTSTGDASIYYTTDGTTPTSASTLYTKAISVIKSMKIKAIAVKSGYTNSSVATFTYTIEDKPVEAVTFSDVSGHWAESYITAAVKAGYVSGYDDGTFKPDAYVTRAQFVKMIVAAFGFTGTGDTTFADSTSHWALPQIKIAANNNLVTGVTQSNGVNFLPDNNISREQVASILYRAAEKRGITLPKTSDAISFGDQGKISSYAAAAVDAMQKAGIIGGSESNGTTIFSPQGNATRAQAVKMIQGLLELS